MNINLVPAHGIVQVKAMIVAGNIPSGAKALCILATYGMTEVMP
jgi:hypothetical protein